MPASGDELSERELEILRLLATGASNKEIAQKLFISANTVKVHLRNIFAKIAVSSRTEAAMYAVNAGLVPSSAKADLGEAAGADVDAVKSAEQRKIPLWAFVAGALLGLILAATIYYQFIVQRAMLPGNDAISSTPPRWQALAPMPTARYGLAAASYGDYVFAIGGHTAEGVTAAVEYYDFQNKTWKSAAAKPTPVYEINAAVIGGKIYVPGGRLASGEVTDVLEIYDPVSDQWQQGAKLPTPLSAYALAAFEGKLYLFGGWDGKQAMRTVFKYDPQQDAWQEKPPMSIARAYSGAAVVGRKIYVLGGYDGQKALDISQLYLPDQEENNASFVWQAAPKMPEKIYAMGATSIADIVYVVGGLSEGERRYPALTYFDQTGEWREIESPPADIEAWMGIAARATNLIVLGGRGQSQILPDASLYQAIYTVSFPIVVK
jgi:DNA-binding CsgD family transcriptional regulator/N-acetylneuraminic acid mutarotase